ncbi:MAG TPA: hypothetical protein VLZ06_04995 [Solirubrobacteraceae bacterium]|nr:hypothetical protein [Solirubrobacteraceae bacterium]
MLTRYRDPRRRLREVIAMRGASASLLLVDRDAFSGGDCRLLAHLGSDEPAINAAVVCADYLRRLERGPLSCRRLRPADLQCDPAEAAPELQPAANPTGMADLAHPAEPGSAASRFELHPRATGDDTPQLRWWRCDAGGPVHPVSVRDAIAALESYEPIRSLTLAATARDPGRPSREGGISVAVLRAELKRVLQSPIVLNRALREAVLERVGSGDLSLSEIATRCGRVKHDSSGNASGETSWLGRRLGLLPEGGKSATTPWIHSDVLALIARCGLGIPPREVEL